MEKYEIIIGIIALVICNFTISKFVKLIGGTCLTGLELWGYWLGLLAWITLGIILFRTTRFKYNLPHKKKKELSRYANKK